jgi:hypothetical protein
MRGSPGVGMASAVLIVLGLSPVILTPSLGTVVTIAGVVLLVAFLAVVLRGAWHGKEEQRAGDPGSRQDEHRASRATGRR